MFYFNYYENMVTIVTKMIFAVLKTTERKACHDDICKTLFDALGWKYMFVM